MKEQITLKAKFLCRWLGWHWLGRTWEYQGQRYGVCQNCHKIISVSIPFDDSEFGQAFNTWVDDFKEMERWNAVHKALAELYEIWAKRGTNSAETRKGLENLMRMYDKWLN